MYGTIHVAKESDEADGEEAYGVGYGIWNMGYL